MPTGRDLKAEAVRGDVPFYKLAAEVGINPSQLSRLLNNRVPLDERTTERITQAIGRLAAT